MANCIRCGRQLPPFKLKKVCQWCVQHEAAQRGEIAEDAPQPVIRRPWVQSESAITLTQVIFGANIAVFLALALDSHGIDNFPGSVLIPFGANFGPYTLSGDWWRLFTYMFLHGGIWHIVFNMWCLWDLGALCESLYGRWTFAAMYVTTGIAAGLASVGWNPGVLSVGASGAIFGLAGALAASFYLGEFSIPRMALQPVMRSLAFFIGFNVLFGFGYNLFFGGNGGVDNAAHVGGLISGVIMGALIARVAPEHDSPVRRISVILVVALAVLAGGLGVRHWRSGPMRMARAFEALGQNQGNSIAKLQLIIQQNPNLAPAHFMLADAYFNRQQFAEAEAEFKRVIELQPKSARARFDLGLTYLAENRPEDAKAAFNEMLAQGANTGEAHYGIASALLQEGKFEPAIAEFKAALADGADVSGIYVEMGNAFAKLKMYDDAIASYTKAKEKDGDDPDVENALADAYQAKGMTQQAEEARTRAAKLKSGQATP